MGSVTKKTEATKENSKVRKVHEIYSAEDIESDFIKIFQLAKGVSIYESGKINLVDLSTYLIYEAGGDDAIKKSELSVALYNHITTIDKEKETLNLMGEDGELYVTCVSQLQNGLRLMLFVTVDEVEEKRNHMMEIIAVIMTIVLSCYVIYIVRLTNKMVCPIRRLTEITGKYAKGDWGDIWLSISYGIACRKEDGENYDEIFKNADERMYAYKKRMKAGRE